MMYSKYDEAQFHLRLTHELHAKIKQRAKMNNRSLNSEIIAAIEESLAKQSSASVYIDDAERMAEQQSEMVKKIVFDTLKTMYSNNKKET
ncbi:Arc family DNA-binding protein [Escherichia coli]